NAILRYKLWVTHVFINRALVYAILTGSVLSIYGLIVGLFSLLLQVRGNGAISLLATGLVAALVHPFHKRLQQGVNRLMYGARDEPAAVLAQLGRRLEVRLAPEGALPTIVETIGRALKLPYVAIAVHTHPPTRATAETKATHHGCSIVAEYGTPTD